jgi:ABC-2 type transport system permease protein
MDKRVLAVAKFEFLRFLDTKGELISLGVLLLIAALRFGGEVLMQLGASSEVRQIVVETGTTPGSKSITVDGIEYVWASPEARQSSLNRVASGDVDGLVIPQDADWNNVKLLVRSIPPWVSELESSFDVARLHGLAPKLGLDSGDISIIRSTAKVETVVTAAEAGSDPRIVYGAAVAFMVMIIMGIMASLNVILHGVIGERFGRICEMVLATMPASTWIDGKLIAATLHGLKTTLLYSLYGAIAAILLGMVSFAQLTPLLADGRTMLTSLFIAGLGLVFWNCAFAAVASLMPNPHSPIRNTFVFVPMTMLLMVIGGTKDPDNPFMLALSLLPPTAPFALPVRLIYGVATPVEIAVSIAILLVATVFLRTGCIRIFEEAALNGNKPVTLKRAFALALAFPGRAAARPS